MADNSEILERLREQFPGEVRATDTYRNDASAQITPDRVVDIARFLRDDPALRFDMPIDVTAVD